MNKDPNKRPANARELAALLRAIPPEEHQPFSAEMAHTWWLEFRPKRSEVAISSMKTQLQTFV